MNRQQGFTLIELMVVIGIIAILSAVGIPAYQNYLRKAALTDMLQAFIPYRTAVELCAIERGGISGCDTGSNGIPAAKTTRYVSDIRINGGVVTLSGQEALSGLSVTLNPQWSDSEGITGWSRACSATDNSPLEQGCEEVFRFGTTDAGAQ